MTHRILRRSSDRINGKEEAENGTDVKEEADDAAFPDIKIDLSEATAALIIRSTMFAERSDRVDSKDHRPTSIEDASDTVIPCKWRRDVPRWAAAVDPRSTTDATRADDLDV